MCDIEPITAVMMERIITYKPNRTHISMTFEVHVPYVGTAEIHMSILERFSTPEKRGLREIQVTQDQMYHNTLDWVHVLKCEIDRLGIRSENVLFLLDFPETTVKGDRPPKHDGDLKDYGDGDDGDDDDPPPTGLASIFG